MTRIPFPRPRQNLKSHPARQGRDALVAVHDQNATRASRLHEIARALGTLAFIATAFAAPAPTAAAADGWLDIDQLAQVRVVTVSKTPERAGAVPAALSVISQDDLRRSGATSIAEALRLAPGVEVARLGADDWAVSIRGFNYMWANKLLVLMDGRSVYTPLFGGTFWDTQDTLLEDIDHIEVVRGPGGTVWGTNAVNGVINILTKSARDTQGLLVSSLAGGDERVSAGVRYGVKLADQVHVRVYAKHVERGPARLPNGADSAESSSIQRAGFRLDWEPATENTLTVQGDLYDGGIGTTTPISSLRPPGSRLAVERIGVHGANLLARWQRTFAGGAGLYLQSYIDEYKRDSLQYFQRLHTVDFDAQWTQPWGGRHTTRFGFGWRRHHDELPPSGTAITTPASEGFHLISAFLQDEIGFAADRVKLTLGSKFERSAFSGSEFQPGARLSWTVTKNHFLWASVSRSVRTPVRFQTDTLVNQAVLPAGTTGPRSPLTVLQSQPGGRDLGSERMTAYELGWRGEFAKRLNLELSAYHHGYDRLISNYIQPPVVDPTLPLPNLVLRRVYVNSQRGESYGAEFSATAQMAAAWRLRATGDVSRVDLRSTGAVATSMGYENYSPRHQAALWSLLDLPRQWGLDLGLRRVSGILAAPAYFSLDARLSWRPTDRVELSVTGQNLLDARHPEFSGTLLGSVQREIGRSAYGKIVWRY